MSTKVLNGPIKCLTGTGIAAGILSTSAAHAQLVTASPYGSLSTNSSLYFNVTNPTLAFSTTNSGGQGEVQFQGPNVKAAAGGPTAYKDWDSQLNADAAATENNVTFATPALAPGSTVDASTVNGTDITSQLKFFPGTSTYGFSLIESDATTHYGYITLTQTGSFDATTGTVTPDYADYVDTIAFDQTADEGVLIPLDANDVVIPEPSTFGLLAAAGAGLAGLSLYRRTRKA